jgi:hypothetical protein
MKKHSLVFFILSLLSNLLFAQEEYFVQVNPSTCSYTIIDSLPGVKWINGGSTFDKINRRYIFDGEDVNINHYLYSINVVNGSIISNPPLVNYLALMKFDNATGILYGLYLSTILANTNFVSINPTNCSYTNIHQINIEGANGDVTFDDINHRFICIAFDSIGNRCLYCIDALSGTIISKPPFGDSISGIEFDNSSGNLYGLQWNNSLQTEYFDSINIANGNTTIISSIPSVAQNCYNSTFDEINKRYTFVWTDSNNNNYLYTVNATNGQVVSNPLFPVFISPYNLIEFRYDNSNGNLYALHWGPKTNDGIEEIADKNQAILYNAYPNPFTETTTIKFFIPGTVSSAYITFYDEYGNELKKTAIAQTGAGQIEISSSHLSAGIYSYSLTIDGNLIDTKRMVKVK